MDVHDNNGNILGVTVWGPVARDVEAFFVQNGRALALLVGQFVKCKGLKYGVTTSTSYNCGKVYLDPNFPEVVTLKESDCWSLDNFYPQRSKRMEGQNYTGGFEQALKVMIPPNNPAMFVVVGAHDPPLSWQTIAETRVAFPTLTKASLIMVRLMLVLASTSCITAGIALSRAFDVSTRSIKLQLPKLLDNPEPAAGEATPKKSSQTETVKGNLTAVEKSEKSEAGPK